MADVHKNWTAESPSAFARKLMFGFLTQIRKTLEKRSPLSEEEIHSLVDAKYALQVLEEEDDYPNLEKISIVQLARWCQEFKLKAAIVLYEDGDPENHNGLIDPEVFRGCWHKQGEPKDFFELGPIDLTGEDT